MMNIAGSICVDESTHDDAIQYLSIPDKNGAQRRVIYWRCALVSFATSIRCNSEARHILYTNDRNEIAIQGIDIKQKLRQLGVDIREVSFQEFIPPAGFSKNFKNAFFKLDVIKHLSQEKGHHLLLDLDCVWIKSGTDFLQKIQAGELVLYDNYEIKNPDTKIHGMSLAEMGQLYREIDPDYPNPHPILFGGEMIAGSQHHFEMISQELKAVFELILQKYPNQPPMFIHNQSIFDNDEYLSSFVYNKIKTRWVNAKEYIRRINTDIRYSTAKTNDLNLTIWHLLDEKTQGFPLLFSEVIRPQSYFWRVPLDELNQYLGSYLGIPQNITPKRSWMILGKIGEKAWKKMQNNFKL